MVVIESPITLLRKAQSPLTTHFPSPGGRGQRGGGPNRIAQRAERTEVCFAMREFTPTLTLPRQGGGNMKLSDGLISELEQREGDYAAV